MTIKHRKIICINDNCPLHLNRSCLNHKSNFSARELENKSNDTNLIDIIPERSGMFNMCWIYIHKDVE